MRLLLLSFLVVLSPLGAAQRPVTAQAALAVEHAPFLSAGGDSASLALEFAPGAYERLALRHVQGEAFALEGWPLPLGRSTRAEVRPVSAFEPGARARVVAADGSESWLAPSVLCFSGRLAEGGELFFGLTAGEVQGYFRTGDELYFLSSAGGEHWLAGGSTLPRPSATAPFCATASGPRAKELAPEQALGLGALRLKTANVFIEADNVYRGLFASDQACLDYSALVITAASEVYRRDLGVRLVIPNGYMRLWNATPPWGVVTTFGDISNVRDWWVSFANPDRTLPRAAVHVLTSPVFGGVANSIGGVCFNTNGYEISSLFGHFPSPRVHAHNDNWDLFVVTHEFGHTFGCEHSFDFQPPIQCQDGSGPDSGTIMSYCHLTFGVGAVGMRFHVREQLVIREHMTFVGCLGEQALTLGDYDGDGALEADDLLALDAVLAQGFRSLGAEEVFDLDGDGGLDAVDRTLLASAIGAPPARATFRNGRGLNSSCLLVSENPVLGRRFAPSIVALPAGRLTVLFFYDRPHPGIRTSLGELLVLPESLGGRQRYIASAVSSGILADYPFDLPVDVALVGLEATMQGLVLGAPGTELCNAYDLVFSSYE
jgi:hypothetical protein